MGRPLDTDLRRRAVAAVEAGLSTAQAAKRFSVSKAAVGAWVRLKRASGDVLPKPQGFGFGSVLDLHEGFILALIEADKDITLVEIADRLADTCGLRVVPATLWHWLDRCAITVKKTRTPASSSVPTCGLGAKPGTETNPIWILRGLSLLMRQALRPRWRASMTGRRRVSGAGHRFPMATG